MKQRWVYKIMGERKMNEKLKPCPFCGGKANVGLDDFNNKYLVMW